MPEIWLKYGSTEVVLDIKTENLLDYVIEEEHCMNEEEMNTKLGSVPVNGSAHLVVLDHSMYIMKLSLSLADSIKKRGVKNISIDVPPNLHNMYKSIFEEKNVQVNRLSDLAALDKTILLSRVSFDPLFGYSGTPTYLLRYFGTEEMLSAYKARDGDMPRPGAKNNALSVAHNFASKVDSTSVEAVVSTHGLVDIIVNKPVTSHNEAITKLEALNKVDVEKSKALIVSSGNEYSTLSYALNSVWNCLDAIKDSGTIALLAECKDGLGSHALQMLVEGKINIDDAYDPSEYIDGIEHLLYLKEVRNRHNISLVSAIPDFYTKQRLGFRSYRRTKDALHSLLNAYGVRQKVLVVSDASKVLLKHKSAN